MRTFWPDYAQDKNTAYGYTDERLRAASPSGLEITLMDEILLLPEFIDDPLQRRIVGARSLVTPISQRHLYSWRKIAYMLHMDSRRVARLHHNGLGEIVECLPPKEGILYPPIPNHPLHLTLDLAHASCAVSPYPSAGNTRSPDSLRTALHHTDVSSIEQTKVEGSSTEAPGPSILLGASL